MAFTLQDDNGLVAGANAYASVSYVRAYLTDRGTDLGAVTDAALEVAIILATQYLDSRYTFLGCRRNNAQDTEWPRREAYDRDGYLINGIPRAVKQAVAELANRARSAVRFTLPYTVTEDDILGAVPLIVSAVEKLRRLTPTP